jgi:septal ring factor EnvC (AmiA/AmiB activator)
MAALDEVSRLLGELQADMRNAERSRSILRDEVTKMNTSVVDLTEAITEISVTMKHINDRLTKVEDDLKPLTDLRNRGMGMLAAFAVVLGVIGTALLEASKHVLGRWAG